MDLVEDQRRHRVHERVLQRAQRAAEQDDGDPRMAGLELERRLEPVREHGDVAELGPRRRAPGRRRGRRADVDEQRLAVAHELRGGVADRQLLVGEARLALLERALALGDVRGIAPPRIRCTSPREASASRSLRIVTSEMPKRSLSSPTRMKSCCLITASIRSRRTVAPFAPASSSAAIAAECTRLLDEAGQRRDQAVGGRAAAQRDAHVAVVAPGGAGRHVDALRGEVARDRRAVVLGRGEPHEVAVAGGERERRLAQRRPRAGRARARRRRGGARPSARRARAPTASPPARAPRRRRPAPAARAAWRRSRARTRRGSRPSRAPSRTSARRSRARARRAARRRRRPARPGRTRPARRRRPARPRRRAGPPARAARPAATAAPVGSFGVHSTTARVSGPAAAASASTSGAPSAVSGTATGAPSPSCTSRGSGPQPGHATATSPPAASARNASAAARRRRGRAPPGRARRRGGRRAPRAAASGPGTR